MPLVARGQCDILHSCNIGTSDLPIYGYVLRVQAYISGKITHAYVRYVKM